MNWRKLLGSRSIVTGALGATFIFFFCPFLAGHAQSAAKGSLEQRGDSMKVVDAVAYFGPAEFGDDTVIKVRLSPQPLDHQAVERAIDVAGELTRQQQDTGGHADLDFTNDGVWRGSSYSLSGGYGCGYCSADSPAAQKTKMKFEAGRLRGSIQIKSSDYPKKDGLGVTLTLDVPVLTLTGTSPLPKNGGDPAEVLLACQAAVKKRDKAAVRRLCFAADDAQMKLAEYVTDEGFWLVALSKRTGVKLGGTKISGGRTKGDQAELFVEGTCDGQAYKGSVYLRKSAAGWKYDHEQLKMVF